jgi:hypothetical protein
MAIWRAASRRTEAAGLVARPAPPQRAAPANAGLLPGPTARSRAGTLIVAARPRQWIKNLLVFAAPTTAGALSRPAEVGRAAAAAAILVVASAGVYLINDVVDAPADRAHPLAPYAQRHVDRAVIAGDLPIPQAGRGGCRDRRGQVRPPGALTLSGAVDHAEVLGQRRPLGRERRAGLAPPPRRRTNDGCRYGRPGFGVLSIEATCLTCTGAPGDARIDPCPPP